MGDFDFPAVVPPPPPIKGERPVPEPKKKSVLERVTAGVLYSLPVLFLLGILGLVVFGIMSPEPTQDYSQKPPGAPGLAAQVVTAAEVQAHTDAQLKLVVKDVDQANARGRAFTAAVEERGCMAMGTAGIATSARAAGAELDAWLPAAKAVPEGFGPPAIGVSTGDWPETKDKRDTVFIAVAVTCPA